MTRKTVSGGSNTYTYDLDGNLLSETWPGGGARYYAFDALNRLICVGPEAGSCLTLQVDYDPGGSRIREYYQDSGGVPLIERRYAGEFFTLDWGRGDFHIFAFGEQIAYKRRYPVTLRTAGISVLPWGEIDWPAPLALGLFAALGLVGFGILAIRLTPVREEPALAALSLVLVVVLVVPPLPARAGGGGGGNVLYRRWILGDPLGSATVILEANPLQPGTQQGRAERETVYAPFGAIHQDVGAEGTDTELFAGHPREPATGLHYMQARWQNPTTGSFLSVDPVVADGADPQSYNGYSYARNNPVNAIDPTGTCFLFIFGGDCGPISQFFYNYPSPPSAATSDGSGGGGGAPGGGLQDGPARFGDLGPPGGPGPGPSFLGGGAGPGSQGDPTDPLQSRPLLADNSEPSAVTDVTTLENRTLLAAMESPGSATDVEPEIQEARAFSWLRKILRDTKVDGPRGTRIFQLRYKKIPVLRLDYGPYKGTGGQPRLHLHLPRILPNTHIPLDPRRLFDPGGPLGPKP